MFLGILRDIFTDGKEQYYNSIINSWSLFLQGKTRALSRSGWWVLWWGQAGAPTAHAGIATQGQPCQNSPICSEVLMDKALGRRNEPWHHSCPAVQPALNCPGSANMEICYSDSPTGAATRDKLISFSENTGVSSFSRTAVPLSTWNTAATSMVPALPKHLQRHELADAIAKGSLRNQVTPNCTCWRSLVPDSEGEQTLHGLRRAHKPAYSASNHSLTHAPARVLLSGEWFGYLGSLFQTKLTAKAPGFFPEVFMDWNVLRCLSST